MPTQETTYPVIGVTFVGGPLDGEVRTDTQLGMSLESGDVLRVLCDDDAVGDYVVDGVVAHWVASGEVQ